MTGWLHIAMTPGLVAEISGLLQADANTALFR
jgi:hypothetical protein